MRSRLKLSTGVVWKLRGGGVRKLLARVLASPE